MKIKLGKAIKNIPYDKLHTGLRVVATVYGISEFAEVDSESVLFGTIIIKKSAPLVVQLYKDTPVEKTTNLNLIVVDFDDAPIITYSHFACDSLFYIEQ